MKYAKDWDRSAKRYAAWWQGEVVDRCMIAVTAPLPRKKPVEPISDEEKLAHWTDAEWLLRQWRDSFEHTYFAGDAFPNLWLNLGPTGHAGYCRNSICEQRPTDGFGCTTWYHRSIEDWETDSPRFDPDSVLYCKTMELARELTKASGQDFIVSMPDVCGNLDALAGMRDSSELMIDMMEDEEAVLRASETMETIYETTIANVYRLTCENGQKGSSIGWLQVWAPGMTAQMQCDISVMLSPKYYETFAMPELERQTQFVEYPLYHLDGQEQQRHLDLLLSLEKLRAIQWTPVAGQPSPLCFIPTLQRIQAAGKSLYLMLKPEEVEPAMEQLSSRGLHIGVSASCPEEADSLVRLAEKMTRD